MTGRDDARIRGEVYDEWVGIVEERTSGTGGVWSAEDAATPEDHDLYLAMLAKRGVGPCEL